MAVSRSAAERAWVRDSRREIYDRFLTNAQRLLIALEGEGADDEVKPAYAAFFEPYVVVQTVAERPVVDAARTYAYRLLELKAESDARKPSGNEYFRDVAEHLRLARHDAIDAMRAELGLAGSARPPRVPNPFIREVEQLDAEKRRSGRPCGRPDARYADLPCVFSWTSARTHAADQLQPVFVPQSRHV